MVPSKNGKLVETCYEIPTCSDVASDEDTKGEDGERVHELSSFIGDEGKRRDDLKKEYAARSAAASWRN